VPEILNSWKEIATYLDRGVRTVQRWQEDQGLPVRRIGEGRVPVFAFADEINEWLRKQRGAAAEGSRLKALPPDNHKLLAESRRLVSTSQRKGAEFLLLDLDVGLKFARYASNAGRDKQKKARNQRTARRAYDAILHLSRRLKTTVEENRRITEKLTILERELEQLGEHFSNKQR
jgi:hypothetical protein